MIPAANDNRPLPSPAEAATAFLENRKLLNRSPASRPLLVTRCARYLRGRFNLVPLRARGIAQRAADAIIASRSRLYFEVEDGGARAVVIDPARGTRVTVTVDQVLAVVGLAPAVQAG